MANLGRENNNVNIDGGETSFIDFGGSDTYTILPNLSANVTITDNQASKINLPAGMNISSARFADNGVEFSVNGFTVTFIGNPSLFSFVFGGTPLDPTFGTSKTFAETAAAFGTTIPNPGEPINSATITGAVNEQGTVGAEQTGPTVSIVPTAASFNEGTTATFNVATTNVVEGTTVAYVIGGNAADSANQADITGPLTGTATIGADGKATISVAITNDNLTEGPETLTLTVAAASLNANANTIINDTSTSGAEQPVPPAPPAEPQPLQINDPLYSSQWYIKNTGQREAGDPAGPQTFLDLRVSEAWDMGFTGKGIKIAVNDDGLDLDHPDLQATLLKDLTFNSVNGATGAEAYEEGNGYTPGNEANSHGTFVGSIMAMAANNNVGMAGIAHDAKLVSTLVVAEGANSINMFNHLIDTAKVDVSAHSYGQDPAFSENYFIEAGTSDPTDVQNEGLAIQRAATEGRDGKGIFITVAAGNEAGSKADAGMTNFTSSLYTNAIASVDQNGVKADYTSAGASVLVAAFGGTNPDGTAQNENTGYGAVSADINGPAGYNTTDGSAGDYAFQNTGTSYANPMVASIAALMLQANQDLGFRDISKILAITARGTGSDANNYVTNKASDVNFGGMHFSRDVGFGLADAAAAVQLAESWMAPAGTVANWMKAEGTAADLTAGTAIPDNDPTTGLTATAAVATQLLIDRVEFQINLDAASPNQLAATITSPSGTTITLFDQPLTQSVGNDGPEGDQNAWPGVYSIMSTAFLGESAQGNWTLKLFDKVSGEEAKYQSFKVVAWGDASSSQLFFTDEFKATTGGTITQETLQAAALSKDFTVDLAANSGKVGDATFTYTGDADKNAIGGSGADTLTGDAQANILKGNRGNDTLTGGEGGDTLTGGLGADTFVFTDIKDSLATARDTITDFISGRDKLSFSGIDANSTLDADQAFAWIGFNSTGALEAFSLGYTVQNGNVVVNADNTGDALADISVVLAGVSALAQTDFIL